MREALRSCADPLGALSRAGMGETLEDAQFLELLRFLDGASRIDLVTLTVAVSELAAMLERGRAGTYGFYLDDRFDPSLARAREFANRAHAEFETARGRVAQRVCEKLGRDDVGSGEFIVMREAARTLPAEVRIVREAPTYFLCELELDEAAINAMERRDVMESMVALAESGARRMLSDMVRDALGDLEALLAQLAQLDVDLAQVHFTQTNDCVAAKIVPDAEVTFQDGAFLPLKAQLQSQGRAYEPISVALCEPSVLTGPNMGGKSAALRACGFIALLAAFGIPVPARSAQCAVFDHVAWIGTGASPKSETLLSSFAAEVVRLNALLQRHSHRALFLIDEFARTTTPHEGGALLVALLRSLRRRGITAFAATHLSGVASHAQTPHFAVRGLRRLPDVTSAHDLAAALDALAQAMDYSVVPFDASDDGQSDAIALAQLLGLDEEIATEAKETTWTR